MVSTLIEKKKDIKYVDKLSFRRNVSENLTLFSLRIRDQKAQYEDYRRTGFLRSRNVYCLAPSVELMR